MLTNEQKKINVDGISLMERGYDPDTYIVRVAVGPCQFLDSKEMPAADALRMYKSLIINKWDDDE